MLGEVISSYKILKKIGSGGMGMVYLNEATTLAKLNHPNIVVLYDFIEKEGKLLIIMEYVEGQTLDVYIDNTNFIDEKYAINIISQILDGLSYAHKQNVIHRDIKPSNIIIGENNFSKLLDFGIAKLTESNANLTKTGTRMGSISYMSPEQVLGKELDARSDIYSMGLTLYELLAGKSPYNDNTESDFIVQNKIVNEVLPDIRSVRQGVSDRLAEAINIATEKNPSNRFQNCDDFKNYISDNNQTISYSKSKSDHNQNKTQFIIPDSKNNKTVYTENSNPPISSVSKKINPIVLISILFLFLLIGGIAVYYINSNETDEILESDSNVKKLSEPKVKKEEKPNEISGNEQSSSIPGKYPEASTSYLSNADLQYLTKTELQIMRNEIFARHGYIFKTNPQMINYFNSQPWYTPRYSDVNNLLTEVEKNNLKLIKVYENK